MQFKNKPVYLLLIHIIFPFTNTVNYDLPSECWIILLDISIIISTTTSLVLYIKRPIPSKSQ
jgi:hypothetical protein